MEEEREGIGSSLGMEGSMDGEREGRGEKNEGREGIGERKEREKATERGRWR